MTENHGYNTPSAGTSDWHTPLNQNFEMIDVDSEVRDTSENMGQYTPNQGAKFLATDTGEVYVGDGSQWLFLGDVRRQDGNLYVQSGQPSNPSDGDVWIDTS